MLTFGHTLYLPRIAPLSGRHVLFGTYNSERCRRASGVSNSWKPLYATYRAFLLMKAQSLVTDRICCARPVGVSLLPSAEGYSKEETLLGPFPIEARLLASANFGEFTFHAFG